MSCHTAEIPFVFGDYRAIIADYLYPALPIDTQEILDDLLSTESSKPFGNHFSHDRNKSFFSSFSATILMPSIGSILKLKKSVRALGYLKERQLHDIHIKVIGKRSFVCLVYRYKMTTDYRKVSKLMMRYWTNFARYGSPNEPFEVANKRYSK